MIGVVITLLVAMVASATPLLIAGLGELVTEKSGVLNLGVEGMMLIGAVSGFIATTLTGSLTLGLLAAILAGMAASMLFAVLTLSLAANQVATGLALTIFGTGFSSLVGASFIGQKVAPLPPLLPASIATDPILRVVFGYNVLVYFAILATVAVAYFLSRTRAGLILRAVGVSDSSAHVIGYPVIRIRYMATAFGGAMAGLAGAYYSLFETPAWANQLTAGSGWIALALVVFAGWNPWRALIGAYLFGAVETLELQSLAAGIHIVPPEFLAMLRYLAPIVVLTLAAIRPGGGRVDAPACLGKPFKAA